jgi:hypothetical protein
MGVNAKIFGRICKLSKLCRNYGQFRVARWHIFKPKIPTWLKILKAMELKMLGNFFPFGICYIHPFGIYDANLAYF